MAIRVVLGPPGAGKTYYLVHHLLFNYAHWDDVSDSWVLNPGIVLYSNISGLRFGEDLDRCIKAGGAAGLKGFFTINRWKDELARLRRESDSARIVFVIDEAQRYFDRRFFDKDVFLFFQWHRHLGVDVYLLTQDIKSLSLEMRTLAEYIVRARRRSLSIAGEFKYDFLGSEDDREVWYSKVLRRDKRVFAAYQSMIGTEGENVPRVLWRRIALVAALVLVTLGLGYYSVSGWMGSGRKAEAVAVGDGERAVLGAGESRVAARPGGAPAAVAVAAVPAAAPAAPRGRVVGVIGSPGGAGVVVVSLSETESARLTFQSVREACRCDPAALPMGTVLDLPPATPTRRGGEIRAAETGSPQTATRRGPVVGPRVLPGSSPFK